MNAATEEAVYSAPTLENMHRLLNEMHEHGSTLSAEIDSERKTITVRGEWVEGSIEMEDAGDGAGFYFTISERLKKELLYFKLTSDWREFERENKQRVGQSYSDIAPGLNVSDHFAGYDRLRASVLEKEGVTDAS